jgi:hypothetical protein
MLIHFVCAATDGWSGDGTWTAQKLVRGIKFTKNVSKAQIQQLKNNVKFRNIKINLH